MPKKVSTRTLFLREVKQTNKVEAKLSAVKIEFDRSIVALRDICPHLVIAEASHGSSVGKDVRVCTVCGIQEIAWSSNFSTLTSPGGSWYETTGDKSKTARNGTLPSLIPMSANAAFTYRRGPHCDVSST